MATHWTQVGVVVVICVLGFMIARRIARSRSGLDRNETAVVRRAARRSLVEDPSIDLGVGLLCRTWMPIWLFVPWLGFAYYTHRAAAKKVAGVHQREQNRTEGVIFSFYELRITRAEVIQGYEENARRIPLQGLNATVTTNQTVCITIEGRARSSVTTRRLTPISTSGARGSSSPF